MWEGQEGNRIIMAEMHAMFRHSAIFFDILGLTEAAGAFTLRG